ncbi:prepilin-type N-terminal cleavage/methylation domain-containing protein, partial [Pseudomonas poae]
MPNLQRGFTLLEMLVVIVLISIAAGLVGFG